LEQLHNDAHLYYAAVSPHFAFRDPFAFLLHSNIDRIYAQWQTDPMHPERLNPDTVYGTEWNKDVPAPDGFGGMTVQNLAHLVEPWSTGVGDFHTIRPWEATHENQGFRHNYQHISVVAPPCYDTLPTTVRVIAADNPGMVILFNDVPQGETTARAAVFEIFACADLTLQIKPGFEPTAPYSVLIPGNVTVPHGAHQLQVARVWFAFTGGAPGTPVADGSVTIRCVETGQEFVFTLRANSIARPTVAVMLALDQSGSMGWLAGIDPNTKRIEVLHQAAANFVQLVQNNNGVGMVSFDHNAYPRVPVNRFIAGALDPNRGATISAIRDLQPAGATSIGNGLMLARNTLNPVVGYDQKALVVFTDGLENTSLYIADVMGTINDRTFAVGLGTAQQVSTGALNALTNNTRGYVLLSGSLSPSIDDYFRLTKYFLQILAGVTNNNIVTDPSGYISPGAKLRIPFVLNETDIDTTVILLTDLPAIRFWIENPAGDLMDPGVAAALGATFETGDNMSYYRFGLPLPLGGEPAHAGTWYAVVEVDEKIFQRFSDDSARSLSTWSARMAHGIRYSLNAHAFSNLRMQARLVQNSLQPGATLTVRAALTEYGMPVASRASVRAELQRPDNSQALLALAEIEPGVFEASTSASLQGVYRFRVVGSGGTLRGLPFTREQLLSGAVLLGGDNPFPTSGPSTKAQDEQLCRLLECLLGSQTLGRFLADQKIDPTAVQRCIEEWCKARTGPPSAEELREREGS
jgi:hypothetical protein